MNLLELTKLVGGRLEGDNGAEVVRVASLADAGAEDVSFLSDERHASELAKTKAAAVLVPRRYNKDKPAGAMVFVDDVNVALEELLAAFAKSPDVPMVGVHESAVVDATVEIGDSAAIGANAVIGANAIVGDGTVISAGCVIGRDVLIGNNCKLWPNVVINYGCELGNNVMIHANSTIGTDGFGYRLVDGKHKKIPHIGKVVIQDDVEIGANSCVDRAKFGKTVIGPGTKIDDLVMVAHNVRIGANCLLTAQIAIAGSSELGDYVVMGGQAGVADHIKIGDGAMIGGRGGVTRDVAPGAKVTGVPARDVNKHYRELSLIKKLPEMAKELKQIRKQLDKSAVTKDNS